MSRIHELLAVEKTREAAWNTVFEETVKKFHSPSTFYEGFSKSLSMIEGTPENTAEENKAREEKPVTTTVLDTLDYFFDLFSQSENVQFSKNIANAATTCTVMFNGREILKGIPVDQCLGLEARLARIRKLFVSMPTLDASRHWKPDESTGRHVWITEHPEVTTRTDKRMIPVVMYEATEKHPAQVTPVGKDMVVGQYTTVKRSGAVTAAQKAAAIRRIDDLLTEIKKARMRANETVVDDVERAQPLIDLLLEPLRSNPTSN